MPEPAPEPRSTGRPGLLEGVRVEVRNNFDDSWSNGFVIMAVTATGYRLRRRHDNEVLPTEFPANDVRRERKNSMWWV
ncbi:MAG: hypothetical protein IPG97_02220 [Microthrixaceae bacterium]|nr:hypothetical protein [Microthrixaceae bacterium]